MNDEDDRAMVNLLATLDPALPSENLARRIAAIPAAHPKKNNVQSLFPLRSPALFAAAALLALGIFVGSALERVDVTSRVSDSGTETEAENDDWSSALDEPFDFPDILEEENL